MKATDLLLLARKVLVGVIVTFIPLLILAGGVFLVQYALK